MNGELLTSGSGVLAGSRGAKPARRRVICGAQRAWEAAGFYAFDRARMADEPLDFGRSPTSARRYPGRDERIPILGGRSAAPHLARRHDAVQHAGVERDALTFV